MNESTDLLSESQIFLSSSAVKFSARTLRCNSGLRKVIRMPIHASSGASWSIIYSVTPSLKASQPSAFCKQGFGQNVVGYFPTRTASCLLSTPCWVTVVLRPVCIIHRCIRFLPIYGAVLIPLPRFCPVLLLYAVVSSCADCWLDLLPFWLTSDWSDLKFALIHCCPLFFRKEKTRFNWWRSKRCSAVLHHAPACYTSHCNCWLLSHYNPFHQ